MINLSNPSGKTDHRTPKLIRSAAAKTSAFMLMFMVLIISCENDPVDEQPQVPADQVSEIEAFNSRVSSTLIGFFNSVNDYSHLGTAQLDRALSTKTEHGTLVSFVPVFDNGSISTQGIVIATEANGKARFNMIQRGHLADLDYQEGANQPSMASYAQLFVGFDKALFGINQPNINEITGLNISTLASESLDSDIMDLVEAGCIEFLVYGNGDVNCINWEFWEQGPGNPMTDAGSSGGGGKPKSSSLTDCSYFLTYGYTCQEMSSFQLAFQNDMSVSELAIYNGMTKEQRSYYVVNARRALDKANECYPGWTRNGIGDAFRQAYNSALNALEIGFQLTVSLQEAHHEKPYTITYESIENWTEFYNQTEGRRSAYFADQANADLVTYIKNGITNGTFRYLTPLDANHRADHRSRPAATF